MEIGQSEPVPASSASGIGQADHELLEIVGKVLALSAALLPPTGFLLRATALSLAFGPSIGIPLAWSAPLPELAVDGFLVVFGNYSAAFAAIATMRFVRRV